jgi:hypothetical protein
VLGAPGSATGLKTKTDPEPSFGSAGAPIRGVADGIAKLAYPAGQQEKAGSEKDGHIDGKTAQPVQKVRLRRLRCAASVRGLMRAAGSRKGGPCVHEAPGLRRQLRRARDEVNGVAHAPHMCVNCSISKRMNISIFPHRCVSSDRIQSYSRFYCVASSILLTRLYSSDSSNTGHLGTEPLFEYMHGVREGVKCCAFANV